MKAFGFALIALVAALAIPSIALAQERQVSEPCRAAMAVGWPKLLAARGGALRDQAIADIPALKAACAHDREALLDIALLRAGYAVDAHDATTVFAELDAAGFEPSDPYYAQSRWFYLAAAEDIQDAQRFRAARDALLAAHEAMLMRRPGVKKREHFSTPVAQVDAYETGDLNHPFVFIAASNYGGLPASLISVMEPFARKDGTVDVFYTAIGCFSSSNPYGTVEQPSGSPPDYATARAIAVKAFSEPLDSPRPFLDDGLMPAFDHSRKGEPCSNGGQILPGFAAPPPITGAEYAAPGTPPTEHQLETLLMSQSAEGERAADYVLAHPDAVNPVDFIFVVLHLKKRGDMERAAFWYYIWQIRSSAWRDDGPNGAMSSVNQMRGIFTEEVGRPINEWAGSDYQRWRGLMLRAASYERKMPLYDGRPDGMSESDWKTRLEKVRAEHDAKSLDAVIPDTPEARARNEAARRQNGLYVGPWKDPGTPLDPSWQ